MAAQQKLCRIDETILNDPSHEERSTLDYYLNATAFLLNTLDDDPNLRTTKLHRDLWSVISYLSSDDDRDTVQARKAAKWVSYFGPVGKALWHLRDKSDPQLRRELTRLAAQPRQVVGNQFLFYLAGTMAGKGFDIVFEGDIGTKKKTPDFAATKLGKTTWVEANAKQPRIAVDSPVRISRMIRDLIAEKKLKFSDSRYVPGLIAADVSAADYTVNELGLPPNVKLREDLIRQVPMRPGSFVYRVNEDPEWNEHPENRSNVVSYLIDEFASIDRSRYNVTQCLLTITRTVVEQGGMLAFPKRHLLVVHRSAEADSLFDLANLVYVVG